MQAPEIIGVPLEAAKTLAPFQKLPNEVLQLAFFDIVPQDIDTTAVASAKQLPLFIHSMKKIASPVDITNGKELVEMCDSLWQSAPEMWSYLQQIRPDLELPPLDLDNNFSFEKFSSTDITHYEFKVIARFWIKKVISVVRKIDSAVRIVIKKMTRIALALMEVQSPTLTIDLAYSVFLHIRFLDEANLGTEDCRNAFLEYAGVFSDMINKCDSNKDTISESELFQLHPDMQSDAWMSGSLKWLQQMLRDLPEISIQVWYDQMAYVGPWMVNAFSGVRSNMDDSIGNAMVSPTLTERAYKYYSVSESVRNALDNEKVVIGLLAKKLSNGVRDIKDVPIFARALKDLTLGATIQDFDQFNQAFTKWADMDITTLSFIIDSTQSYVADAYLDAKSREKLTNTAMEIKARPIEEIDRDLGRESDLLNNVGEQLHILQLQIRVEPNGLAFIQLKATIADNVDALKTNVEIEKYFQEVWNVVGVNIDEFKRLLGITRLYIVQEEKVKALLLERNPLSEQARLTNSLRKEKSDLEERKLRNQAGLTMYLYEEEIMSVNLLDQPGLHSRESNVFKLYQDWFTATGSALSYEKYGDFWTETTSLLGKEIQNRDKFLRYMRTLDQIDKLIMSNTVRQKTLDDKLFRWRYLIIALIMLVTGGFAFFCISWIFPDLFATGLADTGAAVVEPTLEEMANERWRDTYLMRIVSHYNTVVRHSLQSRGFWWLFPAEQNIDRFRITNIVGAFLSGNPSLPTTLYYLFLLGNASYLLIKAWYFLASAASRTITASLFDDNSEDVYRQEMASIGPDIMPQLKALGMRIQMLYGAFARSNDTLVQCLLVTADTVGLGRNSLLGSVATTVASAGEVGANMIGFTRQSSQNPLIQEAVNLQSGFPLNASSIRQGRPLIQSQRLAAGARVELIEDAKEESSDDDDFIPADKFSI